MEERECPMTKLSRLCFVMPSNLSRMLIVNSFIDRYIPGYIFFGDGVTEGWIDDCNGTRVQPPWIGKGLRIMLDVDREVVKVEQF